MAIVVAIGCDAHEGMQTFTSVGGSLSFQLPLNWREGKEADRSYYYEVGGNIGALTLGVFEITDKATGTPKPAIDMRAKQERVQVQHSPTGFKVIRYVAAVSDKESTVTVWELEGEINGAVMYAIFTYTIDTKLMTEGKTITDLAMLDRQIRKATIHRGSRPRP